MPITKPPKSDAIQSSVPAKAAIANAAGLPPLLSLRVLEASIRLKSFSKAALELDVTPSAVTQHIRAIEAWAGRPLFRRTGRAVIISDLAQSVLPRLHEAFELLNEASQTLKSGSQRNSFVWVSASPSFVSKWLLPRLDSFREANPDLEVWVATSWDLVDFNKSEVDLAIRYGPGEYEGLVVEKLMDEVVLPLCSPAVMDQFGPFSLPQDLLKARLLHDSDTRRDSSPTWPMWFLARGVKDPAIHKGPRYNQAGLLVDEAVAGKGIALARYTLAEADIKAGRLVAPVGRMQQHHTTYAHWLVWPKGRSLSYPSRRFIEWIKSETSRSAGDV
ncbi:MAG: LysR family transcriptional regulator [Methylocystaceae bacterium]|nr:MAG: LysR family transcriptional regulator [Methylocystaceae bacterium]